MIKVARILIALTFYHGRKMTKPYTGKYLYLTSDPAYASRYSDGQSIETYELTIPPGKIFSLRKVEDAAALAKAMNNPEAMQSMSRASTNGELDWAAYSSICNEEFGDGEALLENIGFRGIWLNERSGINSILLFDQHDAKLTGTLPAVYKNP